ncbi:hypothetical protein AKJ41_03355 [candidate division MSBL1 archaeon SCGC-AAA259O05]|uniref:Uncharacterized protein n=1 Tax=candidate division MSBL1 archaeon SCGC-AAA259O05 TaxID=1698271 RepID=A0A133V3F3_9EURY|nr:hypothetical protein AKJ41_03355 [candidate division MSBL1 archaeon SCGC-AAA259O05]
MEEPMEILKENAGYQAIVENLEEQGYTVKKENARVVKTYIPANYASVPSCIEGEIWHTAFVSIRAVNGDNVKHIDALVCIDKGRVLLVVDGWWSCFGTCLITNAPGIYSLCKWICMAGPEACIACAGVWGTYCAAYCGLSEYL